MMSLAVLGARRLRSALIALVISVVLIIACGWTATQAQAAVANCLGSGATFAGGDGSPANPYRVATQSQLASLNLSTYRQCSFLQTQEIALTGTWAPIGNSGSVFSGYYDGGNNAITGLNISTGDSYLGLFGYAAGATIRNLRISGSVNIPGRPFVGALLGKAEPGTLIENVHSAVNVSSGSVVGGLVGWAVESSIIRSSTSGNVTGSGGSVGGLVGYVRGSGSTTEVSDSYATGAVTGPDGYEGIAGLLGVIEESPPGVRVSNSYATGSVTGGTGSREVCSLSCRTIFGTTGGLVALQGFGRPYDNFLDVTNSFWDTQTSGRSSTADDKGTGLTTSQMKSYTTYANAGWTIVNGWAASGTWGICDGSTYPFLLSEYSSSPCTAAPAAPTGLVATPGDGSASIAFTLGADNGAAITNIEYSIDDGATWRTRLGPATSPVVISGLTNGTTYQVKLRAINSVGDGTPSSAVSVTPAAAPTPTPDPTPTPTPTPTPDPTPTPTPTPDPSNKFVTLPVDATNSVLQSTLVVSDPGIATQMGTFIYSSGARSARRLTACTGSRKITKAGRYKINCTLTSGARSARRRGSIHVTLTTTFTPTGGTARSVTRTVTLKKTSSGVTG